MLNRLLKPAHAQRTRLSERGNILPSIVLNPIARDHVAGSIRTALAVYEHRSAGFVFHKVKRLKDAFIGGLLHPSHRDFHVPHSRGSDCLLLGNRALARFPQIYHRLDAQLRQVAKALIGRLRSSVDMIVHFMKVPDTGYCLGNFVGGQEAGRAGGEENCANERSDAPREDSGRLHSEGLYLQDFREHLWDACSRAAVAANTFNSSCFVACSSLLERIGLMVRMAHCSMVLGSIAALAQAPPLVRTTGSSSNLRAWNTLNEGILDKDAEHRKKALAAIGTIARAPRAVKLAEEGLLDKNLLVRQAAAAALGDLGSASAIPALRTAVDDESPEVSFTAAKALWTLGDHSDADQILWQVMRGERKDAPTFKEGALRRVKKKLAPGELALMGAKEAAGLFGPAAIGVDAVAEGVKASTSTGGAPGRAITAALLARDASPYSLTLLEWAVNTDDSTAVRVAAAKALGERGNSGTIAKLLPRLEDEHHEVRYMAAASIIKLSGARSARAPEAR